MGYDARINRRKGDLVVLKAKQAWVGLLLKNDLITIGGSLRTVGRMNLLCLIEFVFSAVFGIEREFV